MKITRAYLNQIIREEIEALMEAIPGDYITPSSRAGTSAADPALEAWLLKQRERTDKKTRMRQLIQSFEAEEEEAAEEEEEPVKPWWKRWEE